MLWVKKVSFYVELFNHTSTRTRRKHVFVSFTTSAGSMESSSFIKHESNGSVRNAMTSFLVEGVYLLMAYQWGQPF